MLNKPENTNTEDRARPAAIPVVSHLTLAEAASARQAVSQVLASRRSTRLLIDATAIQAVSNPSHLFDFGVWLARNLPRAGRVALVVRPDQVRHARLIERAARNAGAFLTYFTDRQKAQRWGQGSTFPGRCALSPSRDTAHQHKVTTLIIETYAEQSLTTSSAPALKTSRAVAPTAQWGLRGDCPGLMLSSLPAARANLLPLRYDSVQEVAPVDGDPSS